MCREWVFVFQLFFQKIQFFNNTLKNDICPNFSSKSFLIILKSCNGIFKISFLFFIFSSILYPGVKPSVIGFIFFQLLYKFILPLFPFPYKTYVFLFFSFTCITSSPIPRNIMDIPIFIYVNIISGNRHKQSMFKSSLFIFFLIKSVRAIHLFM